MVSFIEIILENVTNCISRKFLDSTTFLKEAAEQPVKTKNKKV